MRSVLRPGAWLAGGFVAGLSWALLATAGPRSPASAGGASSEAAAPTASATLGSPPSPSPAAPAPEPPEQRDPSAVEGLLTFRGNATRSYYGEGPVPTDPTVAWTYPRRAMCSDSTVGGHTKQWCGTGWTGQPAVFQRDGRTWLAVGAYDRKLHFLDADSGVPLLPPFATGDIIKGSVTVDPDGFPLVYSGSRDDEYRIVAIDGAEARQLWSLSADAVSPTLWNDDWDSSGLVVDVHLFVGGENSQVHVVKLNRGDDEAGRVTVDPRLVFHAPGWDDELLADVGDSNVSIEGSVTLVGDTLYFANSGGLVQGWDVSGLDGGTPERVFRFWTGDDTDATVVADEEGMLYVASQWERRNARGRRVGQVIKLDPSRPRDPLVWSVHDTGDDLAGVWATPALHADVLYVPTHGGQLLAIDGRTGTVRWRKQLPGPVWSSPVVVDDVLIQGDCSGTLSAYDLTDTAVEPPTLWQVSLGGCIESTPAVWRGGIYVGTRAGFVVGVRSGRATRR